MMISPVTTGEILLEAMMATWFATSRSVAKRLAGVLLVRRGPRTQESIRSDEGSATPQAAQE